MNSKVARALVRLYPRGWRERYGAEFEALLEERRGGFGTVLDVMRSALVERLLPATGGEMMPSSIRLEKWGLRAPWAVFAIMPLALLAVAYSAAFFVLWSGWMMLLPNEKTPFVPVEGWGVAYFAVGRLLYFWAPILIGCVIAWLAGRSGVKALWPVMGMLLIAWIGSAAQVQVSRPAPNEPGHVGMILVLGHVGYAPYVLAVSALFYLFFRLRRQRALTA